MKTGSKSLGDISSSTKPRTANFLVNYSQKVTPLSKHNLSNFETKSPTYLASSASAMIPDAIDADTEVAEKVAVQVPFKSEVT